MSSCGESQNPDDVVPRPNRALVGAVLRVTERAVGRGEAMVRRLAAAMLAVVAVITMSACGDDGDDSQGPGTSETSAPNDGY
jgi:hypothetical protein